MYVVRADFRGKNVSKLNLFVVAIGLIISGQKCDL